MKVIELLEQAGLRQGPPYTDMQQVAQMQSALSELGYSVGSTGIDGKYGPRTARAVAAWKKDNGIQGDGSSIGSKDVGKLIKDTGDKAGVKFNTPAADKQPSALGSGRVTASNPDPSALPKQNIINALEKAASEVGVDLRITPNGGRAKRSSTKNHPSGDAADFTIMNNGKPVRPGSAQGLYDKLIATLVANAQKRGVRPGIGGYSWGVHYDESPWRQNGAGIAGRWGRGVDKGIQIAQANIQGNKGTA